MRITKLKLDNFGIHRALELNMDGAVVGITGENAAGKSTILGALNFAFSGRLAKKQEQYVNYYSGAKNGSVELEFIHQGARGAIRRVVGAKPARSLTWGDGAPITKAAEVEATLASILNTDRKVWESAVFVGQGELRHILSPQEAVREELMIKLLGLGFCKSVADAAAKQAGALEYGLQDVEGQKAEIELLLGEAARATASAQAEVFNPKFQREHSLLLQSAKNEKHQLAEIRIELDNLELAIASNDRQLVAFGSQNLQKETQVAETELQNWRNAKWEPFVQKKALAESIGRQLAQKAALTRDCSAAQEALLDGEMEKDLLRGSYKEYTTGESVDARISQLRELVSYQEKVQLRQQHEANATEAAAKLEEFLRDPEHGEEAIRSKREALERLTQDYTDLLGRRDSWTSIISMLEKLQSHSAQGECLVCGSSTDHTKVSAKLEQHQAEQAKRELRIAELERAIPAARVPLQENSTQENSLRSRVAATTYTLEHFALPTCSVVEPVGETAQEHLTRLQKLQQLFTSLQSAQSRHATLKETLKNLPPIDELPSDDFVSIEAALKGEELQYTTKLSSLREKSRQVSEVITRLEGHQKQKTTLLEKQAAKSEAFQKIQQQFADLLGAEAIEGKFPEALLDECEVELEKHATALGKLQAAIRNEEALQKRREEIRKLEEKDAFDRSLAAEMRRLKSAFSREGLPRTYIRMVHSKLADLTQKNLMVMDADFSVRAHPEEAVSFQFTRHFNEPLWMGLEEFSGGQSVMLGVAFLFAVQQLIIPELGILVLDEPSLHLHSTSVEHLRDLLVNYGQLLAKTESQILVCDHNPILHGGFSIHHQLGTPED